MAKNVDAALVKERAKGKWLDILQVLAPEIAPAIARPGRRMTCPVHGTHSKAGNGDGFRLFKDAADTGGGVCNTCGGHHDGLALLTWLRSWRFWEAVEAVAGVLDLDGGHVGPVTPRALPAPAAVQSSLTDEDIRAGLRRTWKEGLPLDDPDALPARLYLQRRGLDVGLVFGSSVLRYHPRLPYRDEDLGRIAGHWPALVALVHDADGIPVTLHRTYITVDGFKAPLAEPKKLMYVASDRIVSGGALPLGRPLNGFLGVAEGIETALAVTTGTGMTVWPTLTATLMERFQPPPGVRDLIIWADHDRSGRGLAAATVLKQRAWEKGLRAQIRVPDMLPIPDGQKGIDWNDVLQRLGVAGFRKPAAIEAPMVALEGV